MSAKIQLYTSLLENFASEEIEILNICDSKRTRRVIDGTIEGCNILNTLYQLGFLQ